MSSARKSRFCGISVIIFQCCFMSKTQLLMTASNRFGLFSRNHFLEGGFIFSGEGLHWLWWGQVFKKKSWDGGRGKGENLKENQNLGSYGIIIYCIERKAPNLILLDSITLFLFLHSCNSLKETIYNIDKRS